MKTRRGGFTLVELLVVIAILLTLAAVVWATVSIRNSDKMRSAARIAQSALLGAKDRALYAKDVRGVRLIRDMTDPALVTGFSYLQPLPVVDEQGIAVVIDLTTQTVMITLPPAAGAAALQQDQAGLWTGPVVAQIPAGVGQWFPLQPSGNRWVSQNAGQYWMTIRSAFNAGVPIAPAGIDNLAGATNCLLRLGTEVVPFHQPITLPAGCVIDLRHSGGAVPSLVAAASGGNLDIMYSPRGNVAGPLQGQGPMHFLLRDLRDATAGIDPTSVVQSQQARGDVLVLALFPQTGLVQTFEVDPTDANGDGTIDDLFAFARAGKSAGR